MNLKANKSKLYILDLDNCLIYASYNEINNLNLVSKRKYHYLYHRPELFKLLKYLKNSGDILYYTASKMDYAKWVVSSFGENYQFKIFSRKNTKKRFTDFGIIYYKSIDFIKIENTYKEIFVLDDRTDLWDEKGVKLIPVNPWMGEIEDKESTNIIINFAQRLPRIS